MVCSSAVQSIYLYLFWKYSAKTIVSLEQYDNNEANLLVQING